MKEETSVSSSAFLLVVMLNFESAKKALGVHGVFFSFPAHQKLDFRPKRKCGEGRKKENLLRPNRLLSLSLSLSLSVSLSLSHSTSPFSLRIWYFLFKTPVQSFEGPRKNPKRRSLRIPCSLLHYKYSTA